MGGESLQQSREAVSQCVTTQHTVAQYIIFDGIYATSVPAGASAFQNTLQQGKRLYFEWKKTGFLKLL